MTKLEVVDKVTKSMVRYDPSRLRSRTQPKQTTDIDYDDSCRQHVPPHPKSLVHALVVGSTVLLNAFGSVFVCFQRITL